MAHPGGGGEWGGGLTNKGCSTNGLCFQCLWKVRVYNFFVYIIPRNSIAALSSKRILQPYCGVIFTLRHFEVLPAAFFVTPTCDRQTIAFTRIQDHTCSNIPRPRDIGSFFPGHCLCWCSTPLGEVRTSFALRLWQFLPPLCKFSVWFCKRAVPQAFAGSSIPSYWGWVMGLL